MGECAGDQIAGITAQRAKEQARDENGKVPPLHANCTVRSSKNGGGDDDGPARGIYFSERGLHVTAKKTFFGERDQK